MFNKKIWLSSDSQIRISVSDNNGNCVFFDSLADFGIDEAKLVESIKVALSFIFNTESHFISVGQGQVRKKEAYISRHDGEDHIQEALCGWYASLLCSNSSISECDSVHIQVDSDKRVEVTSFKSGNYCDYAKSCVENLDVKNAFAVVVSILTDDTVSQSALAHKYYDDGSGCSKIIYF